MDKTIVLATTVLFVFLFFRICYAGITFQGLSSSAIKKTNGRITYIKAYPEMHSVLYAYPHDFRLNMIRDRLMQLNYDFWNSNSRAIQFGTEYIHDEIPKVKKAPRLQSGLHRALEPLWSLNDYNYAKRDSHWQSFGRAAIGFKELDNNVLMEINDIAIMFNNVEKMIIADKNKYDILDSYGKIYSRLVTFDEAATKLDIDIAMWQPERDFRENLMMGNLNRAGQTTKRYRRNTLMHFREMRKAFVDSVAKFDTWNHRPAGWRATNVNDFFPNKIGGSSPVGATVRASSVVVE